MKHIWTRPMPQPGAEFVRVAEHVIEELKLQWEPNTDLLLDILLGATPNWRQKRAGVRVEDYRTLAKGSK